MSLLTPLLSATRAASVSNMTRRKKPGCAVPVVRLSPARRLNPDFASRKLHRKLCKVPPRETRMRADRGFSHTMRNYFPPKLSGCVEKFDLLPQNATRSEAATGLARAMVSLLRCILDAGELAAVRQSGRSDALIRPRLCSPAGPAETRRSFARKGIPSPRLA